MVGQEASTRSILQCSHTYVKVIASLSSTAQTTCLTNSVLFQVILFNDIIRSFVILQHLTHDFGYCLLSTSGSAPSRVFLPCMPAPSLSKHGTVLMASIATRPLHQLASLPTPESLGRRRTKISGVTHPILTEEDGGYQTPISTSLILRLASWTLHLDNVFSA